MIKTISIRNFKSVNNLKIDIGRFNVFIGENGCGKSNILEAVAFGASASADKLDKEFIASRGVRLTDSTLFRSAFQKNFDSSIELDFSFDEENSQELRFELYHNNEFNGRWIDKDREKKIDSSLDIFQTILSDKKPDAVTEQIWVEAKDRLSKLPVDEGLNTLGNLLKLEGTEKAIEFIKATLDKNLKKGKFNQYLSLYKIFSPENSFLRRFETEKSADPLSIRGEGLYDLLREFAINQPDSNTKLKDGLRLIEWFENFEIANLHDGERLIRIQDRYIDKALDFIPQNNANEGFLFLMFYLSLFISKDTPGFFAIDNIEASFHPKLCKKLVQVLTGFSKSENKQTLITTHNPFILDGMELNDPEQRLFVVYRNRKGETKVERVQPAERTYELSHGWINGFLGGVPSNFTF